MSQTSIIFAAIVIAFIIYVTMKGTLGTYLGFFFKPAAATTTVT